MNSKRLQIVGSIVPQPDFAQTDSTKADYIKNKPEITTEVAENSDSLITSGAVYEALQNVDVGGGVSEWDDIQNKPGDPITTTIETNKSYTTTLGEPNATSPFVMWRGISTSPSEIYDDIKDGTSITVSYMVDDEVVEIGVSTLFTSTILDTQFNVGSNFTGHYGLVNASQTVEEILTQGVWTRANSDNPTFVVCLAKYNTSGQSFLTITAPELLTGNTFIVSISTTETGTTSIKLSNDALNLDVEPTQGSENPITSGGVYNALQNIDVGGGGSVGEVSWEDIVDKPFYANTIISATMPTDTSNSTIIASQPVSAVGGLEFTYVKVSDTYFSSQEEIVGSTMQVDYQAQGTSFDMTVKSSNVFSLGGNGFGVLYVGDGAFPLSMTISSIGTATFPISGYYGEDLVFNVAETGTYLLNIPGMCVVNSFEKEQLKQIDSKFIPNDVEIEWEDIQNKPENLSDFNNDVDFPTKYQVSTIIDSKIPTQVSAFTNDAGYLTEHQSLDKYALKTQIPTIPSNVSAFTNDAGYLTSIPTHSHDINSLNGQIHTIQLPTVPVSKGGTGYESIADTTYTTVRYRASSLHSTETDPSTNGTITWMYE